MAGEWDLNGRYYLHKDLRIKTIIGIFDWERKVKQEVSIDMEFPFDCKKAAKTDSIEDTTDYKAITKAVIKFVEESWHSKPGIPAIFFFRKFSNILS